MNPLAREIAAIIATEGPITLERYMSLCLQHPKYGYYVTRSPFGAGGDFITAPEISQMFGEMLGVWMCEAYAAAGEPKNPRLVELGPGRGTLMSDILRVARIAPNFLARIVVDLVETSPTLREQQRQALAGLKTPLAWRSALEEIPPGPAFIVANEFFDALPARHFVKTAFGWRERLVGRGPDGALVFGLAPEADPRLKIAAPPGSVIEINPTAQMLMGDIAARLASQGGALLVIDYGYQGPAVGDTLQAVRRHAYDDPLAAPGEADLTAHVDFGALSEAASAAGATPRPLLDQGAFLMRLGLAERAERLARGKDDTTRAAIATAARRLAAPDAMGRLFKVLAISRPGLALPAFDADA